ncbi:MAG: hypothetical protein PVG07_01450 [Acidobacteriota bacterium]
MRKTVLLCALSILLVAVSAPIPLTAQETPEAMVQAYDGLADSILGLRQAEKSFVQSILEHHYHEAKLAVKAGEYDAAAAEVALFANEGDNAVAGVRKRLLEGGHHYNAEGEEKGVYEPGFVIVTREAKEKVLAAASALRQADGEDAAKAAWKDFAAVVKDLLGE